MASKKLSRTLRGLNGALLAVGLAAHLTTAQAEDETATEGRRVRLAVAGGFDLWNDLSDLRAEAPGSFNEGGFLIDFAAHWRMSQRGSSRLLLGVDVGLFSHESDVFHARENVTAQGVYLTPSLKWQFAAKQGPRYSLDLGLGYYSVDVTEIDTSIFYCCYLYEEEQLWGDSGFGGFIGATLDFGDAAGGGFTMGAKIHWLDLGPVRDELRLASRGTLGPNAGTLQGPLYAMEFGYRF